MASYILQSHTVDYLLDLGCKEWVGCKEITRGESVLHTILQSHMEGS